MMIEGSGSGVGSGSFRLVDPDPGGPKTCGSGGSGSATLPEHGFVLQRLTDVVGHEVPHPDAVAGERGQPESRPVTSSD